jgi:hypothetical protein
MRRVLLILSAVGLVGSVGLWAVSYANVAYYDGRWLALFQGCLGVGQSEIGPDWVYGWGAVGYRGLETQWWPSWMSDPDGEFGNCLHDALYGKWDTCDAWSLSLPLWMPMAIFCSTLIPFIPSYLRGRRRRLGLCMACGYNLAGSPGGCPECGWERE